MPGDIEVWLVDNGDYWKAVWNQGGRRKGRSLGAKAKISERQAKVLCRDIQFELRTGARRAGEAPPLPNWLEAYESSRTDVKASTRATYRECGFYLRAFFGDVEIDSITRAQAADWRDELASGRLTERLNELAVTDPAFANKAGRKWRTPKPPTVARHVRAAKLIFNEAANRDRITVNPFDRLNGSPPKVRKDWRQVTADDMTRIIDACPNAGWRCLFALCRWAGVRRGEALRLRWSDIDWNTNRISINFDVPEETTKVRRRVIPIEPARCPTGLAALLLETFEASTGPLVCAGVSANNVRRTGLAILKRAGIDRYAKPFHTLRKCRETELAGEYPQHVVSEWIGHDISVSADHYLRVPAELYEPAGSVQTGHRDTRNKRKATGKGTRRKPAIKAEKSG